jgi:hypothetical protein
MALGLAAVSTFEVPYLEEALRDYQLPKNL